MSVLIGMCLGSLIFAFGVLIGAALYQVAIKEGEDNAKT